MWPWWGEEMASGICLQWSLLPEHPVTVLEARSLLVTFIPTSGANAMVHGGILVRLCFLQFIEKRASSCSRVQVFSSLNLLIMTVKQFGVSLSKHSLYVHIFNRHVFYIHSHQLYS